MKCSLGGPSLGGRPIWRATTWRSSGPPLGAANTPIPASRSWANGATAGEYRQAGVPPDARQLPNSAGKAAYTGPCPPGGPAHHYRFTVYALQHTAEVGADASPDAAIQAIEAAATARGRLVGTFGR